MVFTVFLYDTNFPSVNNDFKIREAVSAVQNLSAPDLSAANNKLASYSDHYSEQSS